jgi:pimeloyl-ACP methyl ester carboxylesterase
MPSTDRPYRIQGLRLSRREVLWYAVIAGVGLVAIPLVGCGGDEEEKGKATSTAVATAVPPSGFFDSDGAKIHYETFGEGKPIVLVHGVTASIEMNWVATGWIDTLRPVRRVVALDCRGHGQSDKPHDPAAYGNENMGQDVLRLMDYLGIEKADLFGYSMGAYISADLLAHHAERFDSVILGGIGNVFTPAGAEFTKLVSDAFLAPDPSQITNPVLKSFREFADLDPNNDLKALAACILHVADMQNAADFADVSIPVLIVDGADDVISPNPEALRDAIPGSRLIVIPDRDHIAVVSDQRFKDAVVAFLKEQ